mmetsp:Transcript_16468/g.29240  ORF Transcript_16468/g.29240 Transcript_16468/m.29240 type:complete len:226 (+) Transcript_16468:176-853(+)
MLTKLVLLDIVLFLLPLGTSPHTTAAPLPLLIRLARRPNLPFSDDSCSPSEEFGSGATALFPAGAGDPRLERLEVPSGAKRPLDSCGGGSSDSGTGSAEELLALCPTLTLRCDTPPRLGNKLLKLLLASGSLLRRALVELFGLCAAHVMVLVRPGGGKLNTGIAIAAAASNSPERAEAPDIALASWERGASGFSAALVGPVGSQPDSSETLESPSASCEFPDAAL